MCPDCENIVQDKRGERGHDNLLETRKEKDRSFGPSTVWRTFYKCQVCGTNWQYEDDRNDKCSGWSVQLASGNV